MADQVRVDAQQDHHSTTDPRRDRAEVEAGPTTELQLLAAHGSARLGCLQALADDSPRVRGASQLQRLADANPQARTSAAHEAVAHATRARGGPLPHLETIQASFGRHDVSGIESHTDSHAREGTALMGAQAFASGEHVGFGRAPDLFMAAHEAAHVIQQRAGVQLFGGVGEPGDAHERHADEVAGLVVRGESAEAALDRYADPSRASSRPTPQLQHYVQFWGEPDHYAMGQLAGKKALEVIYEAAPPVEISPFEESPEIEDYRLGDTKDPSKEEMLVPDGKDVKIVKSKSEDKFFLRDSKGNPISYGAANRLAGDLSASPTGKDSRAPTLEQWPEVIKKDKKGEGEYATINKWLERTLLATNANHFFPLARVEYQRQHARAKQLMSMAVTLRERGRKGDKDQAEAFARDALMYEGFAGHFLADCFAAGHLAPHALGRIKSDLTKLQAGGLVNTWHDLLNALPNGVPTTLGRFHGDYNMDGHDLDYISTVLANSLLEISMPWYANEPFDPEIVVPEPDIAEIRKDPVVGPLWAQMCGDYHPELERLKKLKRRGKKSGVSKYAIYSSTAGSQVSNEEVIAPIVDKVFGGDSSGTGTTELPSPIDDTGGELPKIRGKVKQMAVALAQVLDYRADWQPSSGMSKSFEKLKKAPDQLKFLGTLQSDNPLQKYTVATRPILPLCRMLRHWLNLWEQQSLLANSEEVDDQEAQIRKLLENVFELPTLYETYTDPSVAESVRKGVLLSVSAAVTKFSGLGVDVTEFTSAPRVKQGPGFEHEMELNSGRVVLEGTYPSRFTDESAAGVIAYGHLGDMLEVITADPRPPSKDAYGALYELSIAALDTFEATLPEGGDSPPEDVTQLHEWCKTLKTKLEQWKSKGSKSAKTHETARREILLDMRTVLSTVITGLGMVYLFDEDALYRVTGRKLGAFVEDEDTSVNELDEGDHLD